MNTVQPMLSSPIKWVGGKSKLRAEVIARLPANAECYCELFAGAGWVLFGKPVHPVEVLNDKNDDLVNLWRVLKWRPAELLEEVHKHLYSRTMFYELRAMVPDKGNELERAVWLYLLIQMSFGAEVSSSQNSRFYTGTNRHAICSCIKASANFNRLLNAYAASLLSAWTLRIVSAATTNPAPFSSVTRPIWKRAAMPNPLRLRITNDWQRAC